MGDWYQCKFLESAENLKPLVQIRSGRMPSSAIARDIAACLQQGRLFFETAETSPLEIRPLQQFYGMVGFAKALTIARRVTALATLPRSHGIEERSNPGARIADLRVAIAPKDRNQRGTFQEVNDATRALNRFCYYAEGNQPRCRYVESAASENLAGVSMSLKDLLSRVPGIERLFASTFGEPANTAVLTSYQGAPDDCQLRIDDPELFTDAASAKTIADRWRARFPFLKGWAIDSAERAWGNSIVNFLNVAPPDLEFAPGSVLEVGAALHANNIRHLAVSRFNYLEQMPPFGGGLSSGGFPRAVAPFNGAYLSEFSIHYLALFLLSTLVRYTPQTWMHAITGSVTTGSPPDDQPLALIEQFLDVNWSFIPGFVTTVLNPHNDHTDAGKLPTVS